jgi:hypothetical protein
MYRLKKKIEQEKFYKKNLKEQLKGILNKNETGKKF